MKKIWRSLYLTIFPLAILASFTRITTVKAQITPDNSLGAENSVVNPNTAIKGLPSDRIDGGAIRGANLFHSFQEFNVNAGRGAYFSNPAGIQNILSRVTGGNPSNILGTLGVLGNANLFFINPNGIIFGPNARLDVGGSFFASTANSLVFPNGFEFSATNPQAPPLLTVNIPIGLRFRDNPEGITVRGVGHEGFNNDGQLIGASNSFNSPTLEVLPGETLALVGGNVNLDGGVLQSPRGRVELGGLAAAGVVEFKDGSFSYPPGVQLADVSLTNKAGINVIADAFGGGSININAQNIGISGQSLLTAGIASNLGTVNNSAGNITLNATGETRIDQSRVENNVNLGTIANSGNINIQTGSFVLTNGAVLDASNLEPSGEGLAGGVTVDASDQVSLNQSSIRSDGFLGRVFLSSANNSVDISNSSISTLSNLFSVIQITAPQGSVFLNQATLSSTNNSDTGLAGGITINDRDKISIIDSNISSDGLFGSISIGQSDVINQSLIASSINIDNSTLSTNNSGTGFAGNILFNALDQVSLANSTISSNGNFGRIFIGKNNIYSDVTSSPKQVNLNGSTLSTKNSSVTGDPDTQINVGEISIDALDRISLMNGSTINAFTTRRGNAGNVTLQANNGDISLANGSYIFSTIELGGIGNAGEINVTARNLSLTDRSQLQSRVNQGAQGNSGNVTLNAQGNVTITGVDQYGLPSAIFTSVGSGANGDAGNIFIISQAGSILLDNNALLSSSNQSDGFKAGNITLNALDQVSVKNQSRISSEGRGGFIGIGISAPDAISTLPIPNSISIDNSTLSTNKSNAQAGYIVLNARELVDIKNQSSISSEGENGFIYFGFSNPDAPFTLGIPSSINIDNSTLSTTNSSTRFAGDIVLNARDQVSLANNSKISSDGNFGRIFIGKNNVYSDVTSSPKQVNLNGSTLSTTNTSVKDAPDTRINAGNISIDALDRISLMNGSKINTFTTRYGNAGGVTLQANNGDISLTGAGSSVLSYVANSGIGKGGDIDIQARNFSLTGGAELIAQTFGNGNAGNINVNTTDSIFLSGVAPYPVFQGDPGGFSSGLFTNTEKGANGQGGEINITTPKLQISDGAVLSARSRSDFKGGDITVNANTLEVTGGGQLLTTSFTNGDAGSITIKADRINLSGGDRTFSDRKSQVAQVFGQAKADFTIDPVSSESGIFANTGSDSTAKGGTLTINTQDLRVENGATIAVNSPKGQAGNLNITAKTIRLDRGSLTAETAITPNESGGNINLQGLDLLFLRNNSLISAKATGRANGGNITIDAKNGFVVATSGGNNGSDITANADLGRGGNINITAQSVFGLAKRRAISGNRTNDIDASSQADTQQGTVNINSPDVDPSRGLIELPENVVDPTRLIAQNPCQQGTGSAFIITGRGGLPSNPNQALTSDNVRVDLVTPTSSRGNSASTTVKPSTTSTVKQIVPAQGWVFNDKGQVVLTAYDPTKTGSQRSWQQPASCAKR